MPTSLEGTQFEFDAVLADGGLVHVRPIASSDAGALTEFHSHLSPESIYLRFFAAHPRLSDDEVRKFTTVDHGDREALVATIAGELVGVARYDRLAQRPDEAEVAFVVADAHHGRGLAMLLLEHLAARARARGIRTFRAVTLPHNQPMQHIFHQVGFVQSSRFEDGTVEVRMDISPTESYLDAVGAREVVASAHSIEHLLRPRTVAVIGAGHERGTIGHEILRTILRGGYTGTVYPVHPSAHAVEGVRAWPSVLDIPDEVDLAVIVVPRGQVADVMDECGQKRVRSVVVISAGFAEAGGEGEEAQAELLQRARRAGIRVVGPNCMGIINTAPDVSLNATFAPAAPVPGRVAFASQSGGLGIAILEEAGRRGIGLSSFVSVGNKADVSSNDLLQFWEKDPGTDVVMLYLESFADAHRFARVARRVSATKPIVAVKAGRSRSGRRAASSHTAALATADSAVDALLDQTGVIRADTIEELFDVSQLLSTQPVPNGRRVAIVGNTGGPGILAADACEASGLSVPELSADTRAELRSFLPAAAGVSNPVDMVASATPADYQRAISVVLADRSIDAVITIHVPTLVTRADDIARAIARAADAGAGDPGAKPVLASFVGASAPPPGLAAGERTVPAYPFPESAARALARAARYGEWRRRPHGTVPTLADIDTRRAANLVRAVLDRHPAGAWLDPREAAALLDAYRIPRAPSETAHSAAGAAAAAGRIGFPVALKAASATLLHKSDRGGVVLSLGSAAAVEDAYRSMEASLGPDMGGALVQAMLERGTETIVGVVRDRSLGPAVMFGSGGTSVELFGDRALRLVPLTDADAHDLVRSIRGSPLLFGYRGAPTADVAALEELLLRVSRLAQDVDELSEMDLNPVIVGPRGAVAVDARIRLAPCAPVADHTARRLR